MRGRRTYLWRVARAAEQTGGGEGRPRIRPSGLVVERPALVYTTGHGQERVYVRVRMRGRARGGG